MCDIDFDFDHKTLSNIPSIALTIQSSTCVLMKGYILSYLHMHIIDQSQSQCHTLFCKNLFDGI
jgi:hypothetical protein